MSIAYYRYARFVALNSRSGGDPARFRTSVVGRLHEAAQVRLRIGLSRLPRRR